jgi:hypothetical protein
MGQCGRAGEAHTGPFKFLMDNLGLSQLVGTDLLADDYRAIHEDGSDYDDDVGGPLFVDGRDGVELEPIAAQDDAIARRMALEIFTKIESSKPKPNGASRC